MGALRSTNKMPYPKRNLIVPPIQSERVCISKANSEIGHNDIRMTKKNYDHSALSDEEFLETSPDVTEGAEGV